VPQARDRLIERNRVEARLDRAQPFESASPLGRVSSSMDAEMELGQ
jgi:hypothetical protein